MKRIPVTATTGFQVRARIVTILYLDDEGQVLEEHQVLGDDENAQFDFAGAFGVCLADRVGFEVVSKDANGQDKTRICWSDDCENVGPTLFATDVVLGPPESFFEKENAQGRRTLSGFIARGVRRVARVPVEDGRHAYLPCEDGDRSLTEPYREEGIEIGGFSALSSEEVPFLSD